jgi:hypothetical protein
MKSSLITGVFTHYLSIILKKNELRDCLLWQSRKKVIKNPANLSLNLTRNTNSEEQLQNLGEPAHIIAVIHGRPGAAG